MPPHSTPNRAVHWLWPPLLLLGCSIALIAWILIALVSEHQAGWFAFAVALDVAGMLHLGTLRRGWLRLSVALTATLGTILAANWGIAATQIGIVMGLIHGLLH